MIEMPTTWIMVYCETGGYYICPDSDTTRALLRGADVLNPRFIALPQFVGEPVRIRGTDIMSWCVSTLETREFMKAHNRYTDDNSNPWE